MHGFSSDEGARDAWGADADCPDGERLAALADGRLDGSPEAAAIVAHVAICSICAAALRAAAPVSLRRVESRTIARARMAVGLGPARRAIPLHRAIGAAMVAACMLASLLSGAGVVARTGDAETASLLALGRAPAVRVATIAGFLERRRPGADVWERLDDGGASLVPGDHLRGGGGRASRALLGRAVAVSFEPGAVLAVIETGETLALAIVAGAMDLATGAASRVRVETGFAVAHARCAAEFHVERHGDRASVCSRAGLLRVEAGGAHVVLIAGEESTIRAGEPPHAPYLAARRRVG